MNLGQHSFLLNYCHILTLYCQYDTPRPHQYFRDTVSICSENGLRDRYCGTESPSATDSVTDDSHEGAGENKSQVGDASDFISIVEYCAPYITGR